MSEYKYRSVNQNTPKGSKVIIPNATMPNTKEGHWEATLVAINDSGCCVVQTANSEFNIVSTWKLAEKPLGYVEGKPIYPNDKVYVNDSTYKGNGEVRIITSADSVGYLRTSDSRSYPAKALSLTPPTLKHWLNLYKGLDSQTAFNIVGNVYVSKGNADMNSEPSRVCCVEVELTKEQAEKLGAF